MRCFKAETEGKNNYLTNINKYQELQELFYEYRYRKRYQIAMDIFRRLGSGLSKLSLHKKGASKSKSKAREAKSDGLTYNSPFGASFRHDPDPDLGCLSFVSPETTVNRSFEFSPEDFDGLEDSDSSFDKPFLDQASGDDLGDGSQPTRSKFRAYWKPVHARNGRGRERGSQKEKVCLGILSLNLSCIKVLYSKVVTFKYNRLSVHVSLPEEI